MSDKLVQAALDLLTLAIGPSTEAPLIPAEGIKDSDLVMKKVNEEEQLVLGVVLEPETVDLHNDIYSADEIRKACDNFNTSCMQGNIDHEYNTDDLEITKSFVLEVDAKIGDQDVKEGSWIMEMHVKKEEDWKKVKNGDFTGFSIGGFAQVQDIK